ncbi:ferrochelatase [Roseomonas marmotae]|uniref:Ferrochelatase n=1 Tax=Roseomonas marmotae TaxID=2768161 RepID=A0ABS3KDV6_9PROT|nr:ferrochelatase [Roseomonas marmotae]MBO1075661.1 ferrochelatase [Roseomonas marmotae]QTI79521.1 ferrochelatase [Roseomonas marmotae]
MQPPSARPKLAIVLFNLGGPDSPEAVRPFLTNLFTDPAILRLPGFVRQPLGRFVAWRRTKAASENYAILGGRSPLLPLTEEQGAALQAAIGGDVEARCFIAMRYWHPFSEATARAVKDWGAEEVVLLPLYPQFSTTTTGSSMAAWDEACASVGLSLPTRTLCCWHSDEGFATATAAILRRAHDEARAQLPPGKGLRILFSAHGLPETIVKQGDPYQWQVERSTAAVVEALEAGGLAPDRLDWQICYQSRVTPQKWLGPSTEEALHKAAADGVAVLVHPIAFVSEHSETLVELDVEYKELAHKLGVPGYFRCPTQNSDPAFIRALAALVGRVREAGNRRLCSFAGGRQCPKVHSGCPHTGVKPPRAEKVPA